MTHTTDSLPNEFAMRKAIVIAAHAARLNAEAEARVRALLLEQMKFTSPSSATSGLGHPRSAARGKSAVTPGLVTVKSG
jgi:hypothetical protein